LPIPRPAKAELVILAVPFLACGEILPLFAATLTGKIVVDATNPLNPDWSPLLPGEKNSAAETIVRLVPESHVVKALNMVFADVMTRQRLQRAEHRAAVFVAADNDAAKDTVCTLADGLGFDAHKAGQLRNARYLEAMAHLNIHLTFALGGGTNAAFVYDQR
jgi:hypothetical protein